MHVTNFDILLKIMDVILNNHDFLSNFIDLYMPKKSLHTQSDYRFVRKDIKGLKRHKKTILGTGCREIIK